MEEQINSSIDLSYLEVTFGNNRTVINKVLQSFIDKTPALLIQLNEEVHNRNWEEVKMIAHKIKSSFNTVGAKSIGENLAKIEQESFVGDKSIIENLYDQIKEPSQEVFNEIKLELNK